MQHLDNIQRYVQCESLLEKMDCGFLDLSNRVGRAIMEDMQQRALIAVVDDDVSSRESLPDLLQTLGFAAVPFATAEDFLTSDVLAYTQCLVLDVSMPGMSGPELQCELTRRRLGIPIIFLTGDCDRDLRAKFLARGAVECLFKPVDEHALRAALDRVVRA